MSHFKSLIWKRAWHGNYHAEQAKPCSADVVCAWCACQAILKSGQDRLTLQASLSHCESVKGLDNRPTDADNWQPGRETKRRVNKQEGHTANVQRDNTRHWRARSEATNEWSQHTHTQAAGKRQHGPEMTETLRRTVKSIVSVSLLASHQHVLSAKHEQRCVITEHH